MFGFDQYAHEKQAKHFDLRLIYVVQVEHNEFHILTPIWKLLILERVISCYHMHY